MTMLISSRIEIDTSIESNMLHVLVVILKISAIQRPQTQVRVSQTFCDFSEKNSYVNAIWITLRTFSKPCNRTKLLKLEVGVRIIFPSPFSPHLQVKSKIH